MMKTSLTIIIPIILLFSAFILRCDTTVYEGTLSVRGNEPHTQLILMTTDGKSYELTGFRSQELRQHQYKTVTIGGKLVSKPAGPGFPAKIEVDQIIRVHNR